MYNRLLRARRETLLFVIQKQRRRSDWSRSGGTAAFARLAQCAAVCLGAAAAQPWIIFVVFSYDMRCCWGEGGGDGRTIPLLVGPESADPPPLHRLPKREASSFSDLL